MEPTFFETPDDFRAWLQQHHATAQELLVGFYKKDSGRPNITWPESVDEALCFGWIDGVRKRVEEASYTIRFTPRKPGSIWSAVNVRNVEKLIAAGRMQPAGLAAFGKRTPEKSVIYSYEREHAALSEAEEREFRANPAAWEYFEKRPGSYRKSALWWVISAKKDETRRAHLEKLIELSAQGQMIPQFMRREPKK